MSAIATPQMPAASPPAVTGPTDIPMGRLVRFTPAQCHEMVRHGILTEDNSIELIEGLLVTKMSKNMPHIVGLRNVRLALAFALSGGWIDWSQEPIALADSEPEPDFALVRDAILTTRRKPRATDVGLVVEIADSTLADDRGYKRRVYARAGLPVYWIVNIPDQQVEVYTDPDPASTPPAYRTRADFRPGDIVPVTLDGVQVGSVAVADVLP